MSLRVYNTLTREKEPFTTYLPGKVGMYLCGPTVYKSTHIGHLVGPIIFDVIKRWLTVRGYDVTWVINVTDVDDKLIAAAREKQQTMQAVAEHYTAEYLMVLGKLGVTNVDHFPKATEHMAEIVKLIQRLVDRGYAYATEGNVWFDVTKDADYGKLSHRKPDEQEAGTRDLRGGGKHNPADFALWKKAAAGEPAWPSPWGDGRPGWHIECSAMSMHILGETFDIHGGGDDLKFPHHENEIAQSESATGKTFARYWLHNGLTRIRTKATGGKLEKMSGSIGNVVPATQLLEQLGPTVVRYLILQTQYRRPIEFTEEVEENVRKSVATFSRLLERLDRAGVLARASTAVPEEVKQLRERFEHAMDDDFNTAAAIAALHEMANVLNRLADADTPHDQQAAGRAVLEELAGHLGLDFADALPKPADDSLVEPLMQLLIELRATARKNKDFATADTIRKKLAEMGVTLEDTPPATLWRRG